MPESFRDLAELHHIEATFPSLILRYKALMTFQTGGELNLRHARSLTSFDKELDKFLMPLREDR